MSMLPTPDGTVRTGRQFAENAMDLLDSEVAEVIKVVVQVQEKYRYAANSPENLEKLRDETLTRLMEIGVIATMDATPCLYGDPPNLEIIGSTRIHKTDGFDHEKKGYEVNKANSRKEDYLGQKGKSA
jgi:hypothetical protein